MYNRTKEYVPWKRLKKQADIMRRKWYSIEDIVGAKNKNRMRKISPKEKKKHILWNQSPACVVALMNLLISMTFVVDHPINNLWLWWRPQGCCLREWGPVTVLRALRDPTGIDVYIHDKYNEIICKENAWLKPGVWCYWEHYMWKCWWCWWCRLSVPIHLVGIIQICLLWRSMKPCVDTLLTVAPDSYLSPQVPVIESTEQ